MKRTMAVQTKKQQERKKFWIRVICVVLCALMVFSVFGALVGIF